MDVVYMVRDGDDNEELRYSLRSLVNLPHDRVFFIGYQPNWVTNVHLIARRQLPHSKFVNTTRNLIRACESPAISDDFILMNDDFFIMKPLESLPVMHRGDISKVIRKYENIPGGIPYAKTMRNTVRIIQEMGLENPVSYELHVPMAINKKLYLEAWYKALDHNDGNILDINKRTIYGNYAKTYGNRINDVKITTDSTPSINETFLSTEDTAFINYKVGKYIRDTFQGACNYERD